MKPAVGTNCSSLWLDYLVCVAAPGVSSVAETTTEKATATTNSASTEPSTDSSCTKYHKVVDGDDCASIQSQYDITAAEVSP
jgi:hypothetical protein